nr:hypothetical protein [Planococcus glaciei]
MSKALEYFKEVYDVVPGWVQKMHDYSPEVLDKYTGIRGEIMQDGSLSRKEKRRADCQHERSTPLLTQHAVPYERGRRFRLLCSGTA